MPWTIRYFQINLYMWHHCWQAYRYHLLVQMESSFPGQRNLSSVLKRNEHLVTNNPVTRVCLSTRKLRAPCWSHSHGKRPLCILRFFTSTCSTVNRISLHNAVKNSFPFFDGQSNQPIDSRKVLFIMRLLMKLETVSCYRLITSIKNSLGK